MRRAETAVLTAKLLEAWKAQALTALPVVSSQEIMIKLGETRQTSSGAKKSFLPSLQYTEWITLLQ